MSRISSTLAELKTRNRKALIPYIVAGDPDHGLTVRLMHSLVSGGADIIELGIPFSDPSSDGATIQLGAERAIRQGTSLRSVLAMVADFRKDDQNTPVVLMGYLNPIEMLGYEAFAESASAAGVDGVLIVDMPTYEASEFFAAVRPYSIDTIFLVAPTTSRERLQAICANSSGYLYYVSLKGVTGAAITDHDSIRANIEHLASLTDLPVVIGFGIKNDDNARDMAALSDGIVVGSALVEKIGTLEASVEYRDEQLLDTVGLIASMRRAIDDAQNLK